MFSKDEWDFFVEDNSKIWLKAVIMQGERCKVALASFYHTGKNSRDFAEMHQASNQMRVDEHFFVIALGKAIEWLKELRQLRPKTRNPIQAYFNKLPHAKDVRNMREHDIQYFKGKGNKQGSFIVCILGLKPPPLGGSFQHHDGVK